MKTKQTTKDKPALTFGQIINAVKCDPVTGEIFNRKTGKKLNTRTTGGYKQVWVSGCGQRMYVHRLIMTLIEGRLLDRDEDVHHVNGDKADNRAVNLTICNRSQNLKAIHKARGMVHLKGVSFVLKTKNFCVSVVIDGKQKKFYGFNDPYEAGKEYDRLALMHYGKYAVTNAQLGLI